MTIDVTGQVDLSALVDSEQADANDVKVPFQNLITVLNNILNGSQNYEFLVTKTPATVKQLFADKFTIDQSVHIVAPESGTTDLLRQISGGKAGQELRLIADTGDIIIIDDVSTSIFLPRGVRAIPVFDDGYLELYSSNGSFWYPDYAGDGWFNIFSDASGGAKTAPYTINIPALAKTPTEWRLMLNIQAQATSATRFDVDLTINNDTVGSDYNYISVDRDSGGANVVQASGANLWRITNAIPSANGIGGGNVIIEMTQAPAGGDIHAVWRAYNDAEGGAGATGITTVYGGGSYNGGVIGGSAAATIEIIAPSFFLNKIMLDARW